MSQRNSEYARLKDDAYYTPFWVTHELVPHLPKYVSKVWEPAAGSKRAIARTLRRHHYVVKTSDIVTGKDFLSSKTCHECSIITNPPYTLAFEFIEHALYLTRQCKQSVAMLLRIDFDSGTTRRHIFQLHPAFMSKVVLLKRIRWIENSTGSPSENHAWYVWDWRKNPMHKPVINYGG